MKAEARIGGRGAGMAAALLALAGRSDRYEKTWMPWENRGSNRGEVVMKEGQESASGATGKVYYVALTRPAKRAAMANHEKCLR